MPFRAEELLRKHQMQIESRDDNRSKLNSLASMSESARGDFFRCCKSVKKTFHSFFVAFRSLLESFLIKPTIGPFLDF